MCVECSRPVHHRQATPRPHLSVPLSDCCSLCFLFLCLCLSRLAGEWRQCLDWLESGDNVFYTFIHPLPTCERDILKTNEPVLMPIGTSGPWGNGMKRSTSGSGGQGHRKPKLDLEAWQRHHSKPPCVE